MNYTKSIIVNNTAWRILERCSSQLVTIVVSIVLLRLLSPTEYGIVGLITVIIMVLNVFLTSGLSDALIQKKEPDDLDYSTLFWVNLGVALLLYLLMFIFAPIIAHFYGYKQLVPLIRVLSIRFIVTSINSIQCAYISKQMLFRNYFFSTLSSKLGSGIIGIAIALLGGGAWALVAQNLSLIMIETLVLWFRVKWRPVFSFSRIRARKLLSFGWKIVAYQLATAIANQMRNFVIGKNYSATSLAFYSKGNEFPSAISSNILTIVNSIMFPVLSHEQNNKLLVKQYFSKSLSILVYCVFPFLIGLAAISTQLIELMYTDKWLMCVPYLKIACVTYVLFSIEMPMRVVVNSIGESGKTMKIELIKVALTVITVILALRLNILAIAISMIICEGVTLLLYTFQLKSLIDYRVKDLARDILPPLLLCIVFYFTVQLMVHITGNIVLLLIIEILTSVIIYIGLSLLFQLKAYKSVAGILVSKLRK